MKPTLRTATHRDVEFLIDLKENAYRGHIEALGLAWDPAQNRGNVEAAVAAGSVRVISIGTANRVGALAVDWDAEPVFLASIELLPAVRGQGLGTRLVADVLAKAAEMQRSVRLQVLRPNPAIRVYERLGFSVVNTTDTHVAMCWQSNARS